MVQEKPNMQIDQILYYLTGANVEFDEEQFVFNTMSNTIARRYVLSPTCETFFSAFAEED